MKSMSNLTYRYGIKMRFYPSSQQKEIIKQNYDAQRFVYNSYVGNNRIIYQIKKLSRLQQLTSNRPFAMSLPTKHQLDLINYMQTLQNLISTPKHLRDTYDFLRVKQIDSLAIANAVQNYHKAWRNYHKIGHGIPQFHRKSNEWSYQTNCLYTNNKLKDTYLTNGSARFIDQNHLKLPKIGVIKVKNVRNFIKKRINKQIPTRIGTVTLRKTVDNQFYVSLQLASDIPFAKPMKLVGHPIGIDLNLDNFLTESNGSMVENPKFYRKSKKKLAKLQQVLNRRERHVKKLGHNLKNASNYQKQHQLVAKLQAKIKRQRRNFLNNLSTILVKNHDLIVAEELRSKNMLKNHALAQAISDAGWRTFLSMLEYKAKLYGKQFVTINPKYTTQRCHNCGTIMGHNGYAKLTLKDRTWTCPICQAYHIRDWNAAINILAKQQNVW